MSFPSPKDIDFNNLSFESSSYFNHHQDSPLNKERHFNQPTSGEKNSENVFRKLYSNDQENSGIVQFANANDKKVQSGIRFVKSKPLTVPRSPLLRTKYRTRSTKQEEEKHGFVAQEMPNFNLKKRRVIQKPKLIPESPLLHTKERAKKREIYDVELENKKKEEEDLSRKMQEEYDKQQVKKEREKRTFKATSIAHYKPTKIEKSNVPLTEPKTPNFVHKHKDDSDLDISYEELQTTDRQIVRDKLENIRKGIQNLKQIKE
eukprot:NODE_57_length_28844_cov_0.352687.p15 type:complete len:261 gc:universal NODE_57_length_28844_cov_0.352687:13248-14030(+)